MTKNIERDKFKQVLKLLVEAAEMLGDPTGGVGRVAIYHLDDDSEESEIVGFGVASEEFHQDVAEKLGLTSSVITVNVPDGGDTPDDTTVH